MADYYVDMVFDLMANGDEYDGCEDIEDWGSKMSTEYGYIDTMEGKLYLTKFWGGKHGISVQLTPEPCNGYIVLSKSDCYDLFNALRKVFDVDTVEREDDLELDNEGF